LCQTAAVTDRRYSALVFGAVQGLTALTARVKQSRRLEKWKVELSDEIKNEPWKICSLSAC
jgi:hypothetical protein